MAEDSKALDRIDACFTEELNDTWDSLRSDIPNYLAISGYQQAWATLTILCLTLSIHERLSSLEKRCSCGPR